MLPTDPVAVGPEVEGLLPHDVTERERLAARVREAERLAAVGRLACGVAHDFNNLLTVIDASARLALAALPDDADAREDVEAVADAAGRATRLVRQLLAFGRGGPGTLEPVEMGTSVRELAPMLSRVLGDSATLRVSALDAAPALAERGQLEQVILNLVTNARDATPSGGAVTIETGAVVAGIDEAHQPPPVPSGRWVRLVVRDTGVGIDAATRARMFEPYFTTKAPDRGTGLGLATVSTIVRGWGGHIGVASAPGRGTAIGIYLPRALEPTETPVPSEEAPDDPTPASSARQRTGATVLLVEDDAAVRTILSRALARAGYTVLLAHAGEEALRLAAANAWRVDLLLTDVVLPDMRGPELHRRLAERSPGLRALFVSGYAREDIADEGLHVDRHPFLQKPFSAEELAAAVHGALDPRDGPR